MAQKLLLQKVFFFLNHLTFIEELKKTQPNHKIEEEKIPKSDENNIILKKPCIEETNVIADLEYLYNKLLISHISIRISEEIVSTIEFIQNLSSKFNEIGIISLKSVGSYTLNYILKNHQEVDFICTFENSTSDQLAEIKQISQIKAKLSEMLINNKEPNRIFLNEEKDSFIGNPNKLAISYKLSDNSKLVINFYFQNVFCEEAFMSIEHWKYIGENFEKIFDSKLQILLKIIRIWRYFSKYK